MISYYISLSNAMGAGNVRAVKALEYFGNAKNIFKASADERAQSGIFAANELKRLEAMGPDYANEIAAECKANGIDIIPFGDKRYPHCLSVLEDAPVILYVKGKLPDFDRTPAICIVGPRKVTGKGKIAAYSVARRAALAGMTVVSGGALGCDSAAHYGAVKAGGDTALVMGCGILSDYLPENRPLRNLVESHGCLISEYPPHYRASRYTFPVRNRILSGLALCTVVIEAGIKSGALITARHAAEQGKDVFVIPGDGSKAYAGSDALLDDGAIPLNDMSDIFNEYIPKFPDKINIKRAYERTQGEKKNAENSSVHKKLSNETLSKNAKIVYNHLDKHKFYPEEIKDTGLEPSEIISALTELEIELIIRSTPGGRYELINK